MENYIFVVMKKETYFEYQKIQNDFKAMNFHWSNTDNYCVEFNNLSNREKELIRKNLEQFLKKFDEEDYLMIELIPQYIGPVGPESLINVKGKLKTVMDIKIDMFLPNYKIIVPKSEV